MIKETLRASEGLAKVKRITDVKKEIWRGVEGTSQRQRLLNTGRKKILTFLAFLGATLRLANLGGQQEGLAEAASAQHIITANYQNVLQLLTLLK